MMANLVTIEAIEVAVCDEYGITVKQLKAAIGKKSGRKVWVAKQTVCYLAMKMVPGTEFKDLKNRLGYQGKNPYKMPQYNYNLAQNVLDVDKTYQEQVERIKTKIKAPAGTEALKKNLKNR